MAETCSRRPRGTQRCGAPAHYTMHWNCALCGHLVRYNCALCAQEARTDSIGCAQCRDDGLEIDLELVSISAHGSIHA